MMTMDEPSPSWRIALYYAGVWMSLWNGLWDGLITMFHQSNDVLWSFSVHYFILLVFQYPLRWILPRRETAGLSRGINLLILVCLPILLYLFLLSDMTLQVENFDLFHAGLIIFFVVWFTILLIFGRGMLRDRCIERDVFFEASFFGPLSGLLWYLQWNESRVSIILAFFFILGLALRLRIRVRRMFNHQPADTPRAIRGGRFLLRPLWRSLFLVLAWLVGMMGILWFRYHPLIVILLWFFLQISAILYVMLSNYFQQIQLVLSGGVGSDGGSGG